MSILKIRIPRVASDLVSYLAGAFAGLFVLGLLVLPHDSIPMGRIGTYFIFSIFLLILHALLFCVLLFINWYLESVGGFLNVVRSFIYGASAYSVLVILYCVLSSGHSLHSTIWSLTIAIPSGGSSFLCMQLLKEDHPQ